MRKPGKASGKSAPEPDVQVKVEPGRKKPTKPKSAPRVTSKTGKGRAATWRKEVVEEEVEEPVGGESSEEPEPKPKRAQTQTYFSQGK